jgi:hypothetical protein
LVNKPKRFALITRKKKAKSFTLREL